MQKRRYTRSGVWDNTDATIIVQEKISYAKIDHLTIKGKVENLGSSGMFLKTNELVPVPASAEIMINFDPKSQKPDLQMKALGKTVRLTKKGVGIKFTSIDLARLQKCIINKINKTEAGECFYNG